MTSEKNLERYQILFNENKYSEIYNDLSHQLESISDKYILNVYALTCMQLGKDQEAVNTITKAISESKEDDFYIINNAGGIFLKINDNTNAIKYLEKAILLKPKSISTLYGLARGYENNGDIHKAIKILENTINISNKNEKILLDLIRLYFQEKVSSKKIIKMVTEGLKVFPNSVKLNNIYADYLVEQDKIIDAFEVYKKSVLADKNDHAYNNMVKILFKQGRVNDGFKIAELAIKDNPDNEFVYNNIADICLLRNEIFKAIKYYESSLTINPNNASVLTNLSSVYIQAFKIEKAEACLKKANLISQEAIHIFNFARFLATIGRIDEAEKLNLKGISLYPENDLFYYNLSKLGKIKTNDNNFIQLLNLEKKNQDNEKSINFNFAIGTVFEQEKNYKDASKYFEKDNSVYKTPTNYDIKTHLTFHKSMIEYFTEDIFKKRLSEKTTYEPYIFILGMPRCGSTLIEQIITSHSKTNTIGENPDFAAAITKKYPQIKLNSSLLNEEFIKTLSFNEIGENYSKILKEYEYAEDIIVSKALSWELLPLIRLSLPNSKIILCRRNKNDQLLSIYKNRFSAQNQAYSYSVDNLKAIYNSFTEFCDHFINMKLLDIHEIEYEKFVDNPDKNVKKLINYCGLEWEEQCLQPENNKRMVTTLSSHQVRKSITKKSIKYSDNFKKYIPELFAD